MAGVLVCGAVATVPAWAGEFELAVNKVFVNSGNYPSVIATVTNNSGRPVSYIVIKCAFLDGGSPVSTAAGIVQNLQPGESAIEEMYTAERGITFDSASCRISTVLD